MSLYCLLAVINFLPSVFGDEVKDRLMYSSKVKYDYPSKHEWSTRKWASNKYDDDKYYDDDTYRSSKQWQRPKYPSKDAKEWEKNDYTKGHVYSHGSYPVHKDEPVKDDWKQFDPNEWKKDDEKYGSKYQPQKYDSKEWKKDDYKRSDFKKGNSYSYKGNYDGSYSMHKDEPKGADWRKNDGKYGSKYSKFGEDETEYPSKDDGSSKDAEVYGMAYSMTKSKSGMGVKTPTKKGVVAWTAPFRLHPIKQEYGQTCWAACTRMLLALTDQHYETDEKICSLAGISINDRGDGTDIARVMKLVCGNERCKYRNSEETILFTPPSGRGNVGTAQRFSFADDMDREYIIRMIASKMYLVVTIQQHVVIFDYYEYDGKVNDWIFYGVDPSTGLRTPGVTWTLLKKKHALTSYAVGMERAPERRPEPVHPDSEL